MATKSSLLEISKRINEYSSKEQNETSETTHKAEEQQQQQQKQDKDKDNNGWI